MPLTREERLRRARAQQANRAGLVKRQAASVRPSTSSGRSLPSKDSKRFNFNEPEVSYKIDFSDKENWYYSEDGGQTKQSYDENTVIGVPVDLILQVSRSADGERFDHRLRLAFLDDEDGQLAEINLNAVSRNRQTGQPWTSSTARSLLGGLLSITESADDMHAFCEKAQFRIRPGRGSGVFVEVDAPFGPDKWKTFSTPQSTKEIPGDPIDMHATVARIKHAFQSEGLLTSGPAVAGQLDEFYESIGYEPGAAAEEADAITVVAVATGEVVED